MDGIGRFTSHPPRGQIKYYAKENEQLDILGFNRKLILNEDTASRISRKLSRHFKIEEPTIKFYGKIDYGFAYRDYNIIKLAHEPTLGTLIHELGHIHQNQTNPTHKKVHTKKLTRIVKRFAKYIVKLDYWGLNKPI